MFDLFEDCLLYLRWLGIINNCVRCLFFWRMQAYIKASLTSLIYGSVYLLYRISFFGHATEGRPQSTDPRPQYNAVIYNTILLFVRCHLFFITCVCERLLNRMFPCCSVTGSVTSHASENAQRLYIKLSTHYSIGDTFTLLLTRRARPGEACAK